MPPKRKSSGKKSGSQAQKKQAKKAGQKGVSHDIDVPIDEGFDADVKAKVYCDDDGAIHDASLNQTNIGGNNNKFYRVQLLLDESNDEYYTHTRWGRVGEFGAVKTMGPFDLHAAFKEYNSKFKGKTGHNWEDRAKEPKKGKYTFIEKSYEDEEENGGEGDAGEDQNQPESKLSRPVQRLMELIFNQNNFNSTLESIGYNANKLPLGKLSKATLKSGFEHLHELAGLIKHPSLAGNKYGNSQQEAIQDFSNKYYTAIPHEFGRSRPPPIDNDDLLRKEVAMLDTLTDMEVANTIMSSPSSKDRDEESVNLLDKRFNDLGMDEMTALDHKSPEYRALQDYLLGSSGSNHGIRFRLEEIFRIDRAGEAQRFEKSEFAKLHKQDRRLLWHGSRTANYGGILSQGLRIAPPEAPLNGYAFGKGVYLSDISSKSAQYCSVGMSGGTGLLLLCEAELGKPMYEIPTGSSDAQEEAKKHKCVTTLGVGKTVPQGWKDGSAIHGSLKGVQIPDISKGLGDNKASNANGYLMHNEYICYDVAQLRLRYLFRVQM